jgi:hypothetical protein
MIKPHNTLKCHKCMGSLDLYSVVTSEFFLTLKAMCQVLNQDREKIPFCSVPSVKLAHKTLRIK